MKVRFWGTRGSIPVSSPSHAGYGGNTSCVQVMGADPGHAVILDAGTGIVALGDALGTRVERVDILLTHLHMDHIIGLGFFGPLFSPTADVHVWGPSSATLGLRARLGRYLSPPLFPVRLRDLPCRLTIHDVPLARFDLPSMTVEAALVCHPGATVGYRITDGTRTIAYLSDHEPALGSGSFPGPGPWTSGHDLAHGADVLIHDAQYTNIEYPARVGWGHSTLDHAVAFAGLCDVGHLVFFHHEPSHDDTTLDEIFAPHLDASHPFAVSAAREGEDA